MKILIIGLGLIGGSMAKSLRRAGYAADGMDRPAVQERALAEGVIASAPQGAEGYDVVFLALPPDAAMRALDEMSFSEGAVVADICGVKGAIERCVYAKPRRYRYVGCHPMAGKEVSGLENSCETLFDGASMIVVDHPQMDPAAVALLETLFARMGFGSVRHCTSAEHDAKIAYTSQLAHIVSNAYVKSRTADGFSGFTGGSFQDMTRIAGVDEAVWSRLYMLNRDAALHELDELLVHLGQAREALAAGDEDALRAVLKEGRLRKEQLDRERKII